MDLDNGVTEVGNIEETSAKRQRKEEATDDT